MSALSSPTQSNRALKRARHYRRQNLNKAAKAAAQGSPRFPHPGQRGHDGKTPFPTKAAAEALIAQRDQATALRFHPLNAYRCRACGAWHIGHDRRRQPNLYPAPAPKPARAPAAAPLLPA